MLFIVRSFAPADVASPSDTAVLVGRRRPRADAEMGNTYALRHHLRASGGDALVREAMDAGAMYVGGFCTCRGFWSVRPRGNLWM